MKTLIVEDDFTSRTIMQKLLSEVAECHIAVNGAEAVLAFGNALQDGHSYDLVCLDIMMPEMDGQDALQKIRALEEGYGIFSSEGAKVVMTTALSDIQNVKNAYHNLADAYLVKPIQKKNLLETLQKLGLFAASTR